MKKLFAYLDKIGADYERTQYGWNYFYNVEPWACDAAIVYFDFCDYHTVTRWHTLQKKIEKYAARYGYVIYNRGGCLGSAWFSVMRADDLETLEDYHTFERNCVSECEDIIHKTYTGEMVPDDLNKTLRAVMDLYGNAYNDFVAACAECVKGA